MRAFKHLLAIGAFLFLASLLSNCTPSNEPLVLNMDAARFPVGSANLIENNEKDFWILHSNNSFITMSAYSGHPRETADNCRTQFHGKWDGQNWVPDNAPGIFWTHCLGSAYDITGNKIAGPGPCDLDTYPTSESNERVLVRIEEPVKGTCPTTSGNAEPATPTPNP